MIVFYYTIFLKEIPVYKLKIYNIYIYITNKSVALYKSISISKYFTTSSIFKLRNVGFPFLKYQILLIIQNANNMKISVNLDIMTKV